MSALRRASLVAVSSLLGCGDPAPSFDAARYVTRDELDVRLAAQDRALRAAFAEALAQRPAATISADPAPLATPPTTTTTTAPGPGAPAARPTVDVAPEIAAIDAARAARGVAWDDVPALAELVEMGKRAAREGSAARAKLILDDVARGIAELAIDRAFVQAKYKRAADAVRKKKPDGAVRVEVDRLFTEATGHVADGRLLPANAALNKIRALVDPLPDPG